MGSTGMLNILWGFYKVSTEVVLCIWDSLLSPLYLHIKLLINLKFVVILPPLSVTLL
jgi:hypothetical protein